MHAHIAPHRLPSGKAKGAVIIEPHLPTKHTVFFSIQKHSSDYLDKNKQAVDEPGISSTPYSLPAWKAIMARNKQEDLDLSKGFC